VGILPAELAAARAQLIGELVGKSLPAQPVSKAQDALRDLSPGQRLTATIQSLMPNGLCRAVVEAQTANAAIRREMTLALPFAARPGETLELEVQSQDEKLTLAIASGRTPEIKSAAGKELARNDSVSTRLTIAGKLIAEILSGLDKEGGKRAPPAPLNQAQAVVTKMPDNAAELAAALKTALAKSGIFYESHQARWVEGKTTLESLLSEPQGRLSPALNALLNARGENIASGQNISATQRSENARQSASPGHFAQNPTAPAREQPPLAQPRGSTATASVAQNPAPSSAGEAPIMRVSMGQMIAAELAPLVQQQLDALASQTYAWQGAIWPGQEIFLEIREENPRKAQEENLAANWTTRLQLKLPRLGRVSATLKLVSGQGIEIALRTEDDAARARLIADNAALRRQFETAGLTLRFLDIARHARTET
jgi:hypothetical protein